jgi:RNA polymerase sigma factor (sigma-70 family)
MSPLLARRQERSFERLYRRHVGDVYRYALVVLRNPHDAEDVTQTTFLNAYRAYRRGEEPQKPLNWLITIAHNVCRQRFRQATRRPNEIEYDDGVAEAVAPDDDAVPTAEDIRRALGQLAFNQRAAIVMREIEGRSYAEIAEILGITLGAVETLIFRARQALREQLEGSLTCHEAERAVSKQLDGLLARPEKAMLRAHLRQCAECSRFARSQRAQRAALRSLAIVPLPETLRSFFGPGGIFGGGGAAAGGTAAGVGLAAKAAAVSATALVAGSVATGGANPARWRDDASGSTVAALAAVPAPAAPGAEAAAAAATRTGRAVQQPSVGSTIGITQTMDRRRSASAPQARRVVRTQLAPTVAELERELDADPGRRLGHTKPMPPRASERGLARGEGHQKTRPVRTRPARPEATPRGQVQRQAKPKPPPRGQVKPDATPPPRPQVKTETNPPPPVRPVRPQPLPPPAESPPPLPPPAEPSPPLLEEPPPKDKAQPVG